MAHADDETASLRLALSRAERDRDEARSALDDLHQRRADERREEQHRLRNMFSVIRVIARRTGEDVETVEDYCGILDGRLSSYLDVQASVMQDWAKGSDLALLLAGELLTFGLKEGERVHLGGPPVALTSRAAGLFALAFHELAIRAIMSSRFEEAENALEVVWHIDGDEGALVIEWVEKVPDHDRMREGASSWAEWIEQAIAHQLAGTMRTRIAGNTRTTRFTLPRAAIC